MRACTVCGQGNLFDKEEFCSKCGNKTEEVIACECGYDLFVPLKDKFCPVCGRQRKKFPFEIRQEQEREKRIKENGKEFEKWMKYGFIFIAGLMVMLFIIMMIKSCSQSRVPSGALF